MDQIITRQEVWKYRKVFDGYERDWLKVPFKKLDIGLISEKVQELHVVHCISMPYCYWFCYINFTTLANLSLGNNLARSVQQIGGDPAPN